MKTSAAQSARPDAELGRLVASSEPTRLRRQPWTHERGLQLEALGHERDQVLSNRAGWDLGEYVSELAHETILAVGGAQVGPLYVVQHVEACERDGPATNSPAAAARRCVAQRGGIDVGRK